MRSRTDPVVVVDYDPVWRDTFELLSARLRSALGDLAIAIEHVGSTAVPGLAAKPVVDIDVVLRSEADLPAAGAALATLGYAFIGDLGITGREAFRAPAADPPHNLYVCAAGAVELQRHLTFRDALRADSALAQEYAELKRDLAARYRDDRDSYTEGKTPFVTRVLMDARTPDKRRLPRR